MNRVFADEATDRAFASRGYMVRPFLGADEIRSVERLHAELLPALDADFSATILSDDSGCRQRVSSGLRTIIEEPLRRALPYHKLLMATFVTKRADTTRGRLPLHQDFWTVNNRVQRGLRCWCPLVDVRPDNGCLRVVPGVHRLLNDPYPVHPKYRTAYHPRLSEIEEEFAMPVSMSAGTALMYDERMLHGSGENRSDRVRVAFNCMMVPDNLNPLLYQWDERTPGALQVLEVDETFLCSFRFGVPVVPPYPNGVRLIGTVDAATTPLRDEDLNVLRLTQQSFTEEDQAARQ